MNQLKRLFISSIVVLPLLIGATPAAAQVPNIRAALKSIPSSRVTFSPGVVGVVIQNAVNHVYILHAKSGQTMRLIVNSLGARAGIVVYGVDGQPLTSPISGFSDNKEIELNLPKSGDYYIEGISGSTNHLYDFTVRVE